MGVRTVQTMVVTGMILVMSGCQRDTRRADHPQSLQRLVRETSVTADPQPDSTPTTGHDPKADIARLIPDPARVREAYAFLTRTSLVESHLVGLGAVESVGFIAFTTIMRSDEARTLLESLLEEAQPAGRAYALCGLYHLNREGSRDRIATYAEDDTPVQILFGCIGGNKTLGTFIRYDMPTLNAQLTGVLDDR